MKKKRQKALDFLTTYGWAIILAIISVGILAYVGILNTERYMPETCIIGQGLSCEEFLISRGGEVTIAIKNLGEKELNDVSLKVGEVDSICIPSNVAPDSTTTCRSRLDGQSKGQPFSETMTFTYTEDGSANQTEEQGQVSAVYVEH